MAWARVHPCSSRCLLRSHFIFQHLEDLEDVITARQTCSLLASVGAEYLLEEVAVAYYRDKFNALLAIAGPGDGEDRAVAIFPSRQIQAWGNLRGGERAASGSCAARYKESDQRGRLWHLRTRPTVYRVRS